MGRLVYVDSQPVRATGISPARKRRESDTTTIKSPARGLLPRASGIRILIQISQPSLELGSVAFRKWRGLQRTGMLSPYSAPEVVLGKDVLCLGLLWVAGRLLHSLCLGAHTFQDSNSLQTGPVFPVAPRGASNLGLPASRDPRRFLPGTIGSRSRSGRARSPGRACPPKRRPDVVGLPASC